MINTGTLSSAGPTTIMTGDSTGSAVNLISLTNLNATTVTCTIKVYNGTNTSTLAVKVLALNDSFMLQTEKLLLSSGNTVTVTLAGGAYTVDYVVSYLNGI